MAMCLVRGVRRPRITLLAFVAIGVLVGTAFAGGAEVFDLNAELRKVDQGRRSVNASLIKTAEYTVNGVAARGEIPMHRHENGSHVLYIVSGRGTAVLGDKTVTLTPGTIVHIPKGVDHSIRVDGEKLTFVDFVQHAADPAQAERSR